MSVNFCRGRLKLKVFSIMLETELVRECPSNMSQYYNFVMITLYLDQFKS